MLMLLFSLGNSRYAIPAREVLEVAPLVRLETIAMTPDYVAGLFNYRGRHVPVIDLCRLIEGARCEDAFTSRVILVEFSPTPGHTRMLGLLAEQVTEAVPLDEAQFSSTGVTIEDAPFLGEAALTEYGLVQRISVHDLLSDAVRTLLFPQEAG